MGKHPDVLEHEREAAMESGDLGALEAELQGKAGAPESLGEAGAAVGAVVRLAHERLLAWRRASGNLRAGAAHDDDNDHDHDHDEADDDDDVTT